MVRGFTPIIGLAVVMALALAAVFGSMSLANPAQAQDAAMPVVAAKSTDAVILSVRENEEQMIDPSDYFRFMTTGLTTGDNVAVTADIAYTVTALTADSVAVTGEIEAETGMLTVTGAELGTTRSLSVTVTATATFTDPDGTTVAVGSVSDSDGITLASGDETADQILNFFNQPEMMFRADSKDPGDNTRYVLNFKAVSEFDPGFGDIKIKLEDFDLPSSINRSSVSVAIRDDNIAAITDPFDTSFNPEDVTVSGSKVVITVGALNPNDRDTNGNPTPLDIDAGADIRIVIRQTANISNPSEAGGYPAIIEGFGIDLETEELDVPYLVELDEDDGGRGTPIVATGKGFKNGTALTFWLDTGQGSRDGMKGSDEEPLCTDSEVSGNVGTCEFTITNPPFMPGDGDGDGVNFINALDGDGMSAKVGNDHQFKLKPSIAVTPAGGSPGQTMLVQLVDFGTNAQVSSATLAGEPICGVQGMPNCGSTLTIPNGAEIGSQRLEVEATTGGTASKNINIGGPTVMVTPSTMVPNQRLSMTGTGFTAGSYVKTITIGSEEFTGFERDNTNQDVRVDNNGNWSTSVIVPISAATVSPGARTIRVTDGQNRSGTVDVEIPSREVTITPSSGRIGTIAVVGGKNFPSQNDDGVPVNITITYKSSSPVRVSASPNAGGEFEAQLRIPNTAIPGQSHSVEVSFGLGLPITTVQHEVPAGIIELSETSGPSGSTVTIKGIGFRAHVPVNTVSIGGIEVTPSPKPSTNLQGDFEFDVLVPGLGAGIQTIEVRVGGGTSGTTASTGFTIAESGVTRGATKPVAEAVEPLGDNLVSVFHFNNDTKAWTFYSSDPAVADANTLTHMITGETYLLQIKSDQSVILNTRTRNLTCVGGNCWNQVVW